MTLWHSDAGVCVNASIEIYGHRKVTKAEDNVIPMQSFLIMIKSLPPRASYIKINQVTEFGVDLC